MTFTQIRMAIYTTFINNYFGLKLKLTRDNKEKKRLRVEFSRRLLKMLNIRLNIIGAEKIPNEGQYLLISNHRSISDPIIIEAALAKSTIFGYWISKKELYNSLFFGLFTRNAGTILLDRESSQMAGFFSDVKKCVQEGDSIFIFPEGTRNKSDKEVAEFQGGARLIAVKNRLPMLPIYIRSQANEILKDAIANPKQEHVIEIEIGDIIDYKDKTLPLEDAYKKQFSIA